ncbi:tRNA preQ1(34) S-adenosylmethionine ribosyltransferase-isomerase QueA, partial [Patescibacteria group bacterium]
MKLSEFNYKLPKKFIAQKPLEPRHNSKLMVLHRDTKKIEHSCFFDILKYLRKGDVLVANDSRVIPARLFGKKKDTGAKVEILLLYKKSKLVWQALVKPAKRLKDGIVIHFVDIEAKIIKNIGEGLCEVKFSSDIEDKLDKIGIMPLPPYIHNKLEDTERYQTIYSKIKGSAAAPTAGLHFTDQLISKIKKKGIELKFVTLHVGLDTFRPIQEDNIEDHKIHSEYCALSSETASELNEAVNFGKRIIAVGTTSARVLETACGENGKFKAFDGWTDIYIYPGYKFKAIRGLITNFHLPKSSLLLMVSAFSGYNSSNVRIRNGKEFIFKAYQ